MRGLPAAWRHASGAAAVGVLALLAQLPTLDRSVVPVDEGQLLAIADRLRHGEALYRDIYTGIFPGVYWTAAGLLEWVADDAVALRWAQALVNAATAACLWLLSLHAMRPVWALLPPLLYAGLVVVDFPGLTMLNYSPLSLVFALFALLVLLRYVESARVVDGLVVGLLLGACGLVKQNFGGLAVLAVGAGIVASRRGAALGQRSLLAGLAPIAAGGAALSLAAVAALALSGALDDFLRQTLFVIHRSQLEAFNDPIPPIFGPHPDDDSRFVFVYTPAALFNYLVRGEPFLGLPVSPALRGAAIRLAYGGTLASLVGGLALAFFERGEGPPAPRRAARLLIVFAAVFFLGVFPSAIWSHLAFVLPPLLVVLALLGDRVSLRLERVAVPAAWAWRLPFLALAVLAVLVVARVSLDLRRWYAEPLGLPRGSLFVEPAQRAQLRGGARFLAGCAPAEESVFVAPDMPILYFLAARRNPTPYDLVIPGDVDGRVIVERLEATGTRCVVYNPNMYLQFAPFGELFPEVARYLEGAYRRAAVMGAPGREWVGLVRERKRGP